MTKFKHQKAPSKGGHHLGLFNPTTHLIWYRETPRSVTHLTNYGARRL